LIIPIVIKLYFNISDPKARYPPKPMIANVNAIIAKPIAATRGYRSGFFIPKIMLGITGATVKPFINSRNPIANPEKEAGTIWTSPRADGSIINATISTDTHTVHTATTPTADKIPISFNDGIKLNGRMHAPAINVQLNCDNEPVRIYKHIPDS